MHLGKLSHDSLECSALKKNSASFTVFVFFFSSILINSVVTTISDMCNLCYFMQCFKVYDLETFIFSSVFIFNRKLTFFASFLKSLFFWSLTS